MRYSAWQKCLTATACAILLLACFGRQANAQDDAFGDAAADPVKLFERGQNAHAKGNFEQALEFYDQALKIKPEFPEAEFQRGNALVSLSRIDEAEVAYRRAVQLKKNWSLPYSALGALLVRRGKDAEADAIFRQALVIDPKDNVALRMLSEIRLRAGDKKEALDFAKRATLDKDAPASAWVILAVAERGNGDQVGARRNLDQVLADDPRNLAALIERADLLTEEKTYDAAVADLKAAEKLQPGDKFILARLAFVYQQAGKAEEAAAMAKAAGLEVQAASGGDKKNGVIGTPEEIEAANSEDPATARKAIEKLLAKNPRNPMLLSKLGASFRTEDPQRSLDYYRQAVEVQPDVPEYALGYASALIQARRFAEAAHILRQVVKATPNSYVAHANLATALYELKQYSEALPEYEWLLAANPKIVVAHYFIATAHDFLGEYPEALSSYENFLASADASTNQLEIDKVKLRLPTLRRQIQLGEGVKKKP
jgi:tetratricopeptide (TPR) repeat protein